ncbi:hypothetical protein K227x_22370 [Rubripirellula lacrimiformis]|uniref:Uncharacterized protein n=1 Tax=Rubripirellula lacrimiformis TaxID=1930273 RepID=A0A517N9P2_9BACT|nr:hypothetical protein [Rubripirellula lacrimiformis]QDT03852.1 hypothetical protein K227x_22370 [Rubripirellula lacrimiformis]
MNPYFEQQLGCLAFAAAVGLIRSMTEHASTSNASVLNLLVKVLRGTLSPKEAEPRQTPLVDFAASAAAR